MNKITFEQTEYTTNMYGKDQEYVLLNGKIFAYIALSNHTQYEDCRLFFLPSGSQCCNLAEKIGKPESSCHLTENQVKQALQEKPLGFADPLCGRVSALLDSGIIAGLEDESYCYGFINFRGSALSGKLLDFEKFSNMLPRILEAEGIKEVYFTDFTGGSRTYKV